MNRLFLFEFKKVVKKATTLVAFSLTIAAVIGLYFFNYSVGEDVHKGNITWLQNHVLTTQNFLSEAESELKEVGKTGDSEIIEETQGLVDHFQNRLEINELKYKNYSQGNWGEIHQEHIDEIQPFLSPDFNGTILAIEKQEGSNYTIRATYAELEWLKKNNLTPFIQNTNRTPFLATIYDEFTGSNLDDWKEETKRYGTPGYYYLYQMIPQFYIPILILIACFIFANNISAETSNKNKALYFYFVLPIQKRKLFIAKYVSGIVCTVGFVLLTLLLPLLSSLTTKGLGSLKYPVLVYEGSKPNPYGSEFNKIDPEKDLFHFINLGDYLWQVLALTILLVIFMYSIYYALSLFIKSPIVTATLIGIITFVGMNTYSGTYNPFTYVDIHKVLNGEIATLTFNPDINFQNGMLSLFIVSVLIVLLSYKLFERARY